MGTLLSPIQDDYCRLIWQQMYERDCWLSVNFVRGVDNTDADAASRLFNDRTEWALPSSVFMTLAQCFGCPTIDLFASRLNKKLNRYISWAPDPFCTEVDAFYYTWSQEFLYLYPPFNLLNRCVRKIIDDRVEHALIIFPLWPMQHWFTPLIEIVASHIFVLPKEPAIYLPWQDHHQRQRHPNYKSMHLAAALVSADENILNEFHRKSTATNYLTIHKKWNNYCRLRKTNPYTPSVKTVLEFLHNCLQNKPYASKYITNILQALKWIVHPRKHHILSHVYVKRFTAGYFNKHPPKPKPPRMTWDIQLVLDYWISRPDNHALNVLELGQKAVTLIL